MTHTKGPIHWQAVDDMARAYCDRKGYKNGPARKMTYLGYVAAMTDIDAPSLLEALEDLLGFQQYVGVGIPEEAGDAHVNAVQKARAALAKATPANEG